MSVLVGGVYISSVSISFTSDVTVVSFDFLRARFPSRLSQERQAQRLAFTIDGGPHGSFTMELACSVSHVLATDVYMALDRKTGVREWLIGLGPPSSNVFDHLHALDPRAGSSEPLAMSERWQPVPLRDNINGYHLTGRTPPGSEPLNPANINRSHCITYFCTPVRVCA
ncbi:hypothetical protein B0H13DRAFT_1932480 [Mycena leptocephala]|nr:hypothetical protein B0H13DRAFT_1932480 [Mycena leptocephala]